jgi:hypothetical protein
MTVKQDWSRLRCFQTYGRVISHRNALLNISSNIELLPEEKILLVQAANVLDKLISSFNTATAKTLSYNQYHSFRKTGVVEHVKKKSSKLA